jgi:hypothetical protein
MKIKMVSILILVLIGTGYANSQDFECIITTAKKEYTIGETPEIKISISNKTERDVYLINSLAASEGKSRYPYSYFTIQKPANDSLTNGSLSCGFTNQLRKEDFWLIKSGESFDPNKSVGSYEIKRKEHFRNAGKYKITYYYSTKSTTFERYLGVGHVLSKDQEEELKELFNKVLHIELRSNTLEIEILE